ncbi:MAG: BglG family transcription antiterminator [Anaerostipes faecalis]|nr:BglG family transcription antiterminator [Anaerostipes faecalis]
MKQNHQELKCKNTFERGAPLYLDERGYAVLKTIVNNPAITGKEVEASLQLTRKQLSYTIEKINDYLQGNGMPKIERLRTGKFIIPVAVLEQYQTEDIGRTDTTYIYSDKERGFLIYLMLLCIKEELSIYHFTSELQVSKNTFLTDLKKLEKKLESYHLEVSYSRQEGYHLVGSEYSKREMMITAVRGILKLPNGKDTIMGICRISQELMRQVENQINVIENRLKIRFTDERLKELPLILCLIVIRTRKGRILREVPETFQHIAGTKEYSVMLEFAKEYDITWQTEKLFLAAQIQISNFHGIQSNESQQEEELMKASEEVITNFENLICVTINERDMLLEALFQHIKPAFYRMKYHYHIEQSIVDMVLPMYNSLHAVVRKSISPFEKLVGEKFPDEELVYITALFGAWLRREGILDLVETRKRALVVCANGVSVSNFLYFSLRELFPEIDFIACLSMREFAEYDEKKFDIVFTMVRLETRKMQFLVKPFIDEISKRKFREKVMGELTGIVPHEIDVIGLMDIIKKYADIQDEETLKREIANALTPDFREEPKINVGTQLSIELKDVLVKDTIQVLDHTLPWEDAVRITGIPLINRGDVTEEYVEQAIENIKDEHPFIMIADGVIIAHAGVDDGAKRVCLSLLTLPEKINVDDYMEADVIIMIGTPDPTKHLEVLEELNYILENKKTLQILKKAEKPDDILELIQKEKEK